MAKSDVYSWRLPTDLKHRLQARARADGLSFAALLERIVREWLRSSTDAVDEAEQERLRAAAAPWIGAVVGGDAKGSRRGAIRARIRAKFARGRRARTA